MTREMRKRELERDGPSVEARNREAERARRHHAFRFSLQMLAAAEKKAETDREIVHTAQHSVDCFFYQKEIARRAADHTRKTKHAQ